MEKLPSNLPDLISSANSVPVSMQPTKAAIRQAAAAMESLMAGRPSNDRENEQYLAEMTRSLSWLTAEELAWLTHPRDGLHTVCKYLPTPADVHDFLRRKREKRDQFRPAATHYHKAEPLTGPWDLETDYERKRRLVREVLGYNPDTKPIPPRPTLPDDWSSANLKTPAKPPSDELRQLIADQEAA